ncbi:MAG: class I adenylate-forming enzyme family protein [Candidatus Zixiibacteriota bacterium]
MDMNEVIADPVRIAAQKWPDDTAVISDNTSLTFSEYDVAIDSAVRFLLDKQVESEDIIAVLGRNSISVAVLFWAAYRLGVTLMPLNSLASIRDWKDQLDHAGCNILFYESSFSEYSGILPQTHELQVTYKAKEHELNKKAYQFLSLPAVVQFTSGSTGKPRGVVLDWGNVFYSAQAANEALEMSPDDTWLAVLPFYHIGGLSIMFRTVLSGSRMRVFRRFTPSEILKAVSEFDSPVISVVPTMLKMLMEHDTDNRLAGCKAIVLGGAALDEPLRKDILARKLPVLTTYGMTETASMVSLLPLADKGVRLDTSGKTLAHAEIKSDARGRILVRGQSLFAKYLQGERMTDSDGWFDTGDTGFIDDSGYLIITGRDDRQIKSGGENIDLNRIEAVLLHHDAIAEAVVLSRDDDKWGQRPVAFIRTTDAEFNLDELAKRIAAELGKIHIPDVIETIDEFPLTAVGKYDFPALRERFAHLFTSK